MWVRSQSPTICQLCGDSHLLLLGCLRHPQANMHLCHMTSQQVQPYKSATWLQLEKPSVLCPCCVLCVLQVWRVPLSLAVRCMWLKT